MPEQLCHICGETADMCECGFQSACTCGRGQDHHHPNCPLWDSSVDNYDDDGEDMAADHAYDCRVDDSIGCAE